MLHVVLIAMLAPGGEPPDAALLLREAGAKIKALEGFSVAMRQRVFSPGRSMRTSTMTMDVAPGGRARIYLERERQLTVSSGEKWWRYSEATHQYVESADREGGLAWGTNQTVQRFRERLDGLVANAGRIRFVKWDKVSEGGAKKECAVVELRSKDDGGQWLARVWIEPESRLVWRLDLERIAGVGESGEAPRGVRSTSQAGELTRTTTETLFQWKSLTAPGEAGLFAFVPPEGAQLAAAPEK